ncbi:MAG: efflux RND transporter periplasmic adaptor subunit [Gallionella sp.]|jgi:RND family efflux transporter MFP subunit|nr:efflux RND transporter periplasmic adaptor subunit [Gallionella sp.]
MYKASLLLGIVFLSTIETASATVNDIAINAKQITSLGIAINPLPAKQSGEVSGLPGQVIVPGNQMYVVSTPLPAMIEQILVGVGDSVKRGQTIALLQSPALAEVQRGLLQSSVQRQLTRDNLARDQSLYKDGIISESRLRNSQALALEAQAAFSERRQMLRLSGMSDNAIAQLQSSSNLNSQLTVTSPIDGVVLEKTAGAGQRLDAAVPIFKIARVDSLSLEIQAPLAMVRDLKVGAPITIPAYSASGKLTAIGHSLTGTNQTVLLRGVILQGMKNLRPGQFVETSVGTSTSGQVQYEISNSAIARIDGRAVVFIRTPQGFHAETVQILNEGAQSSVISGALKGVEQIATHGVSALKSSMMGIGDK